MSRHKYSKLEERLCHNENAWTKLLGSMADFARLWRRLESENIKLKKRVERLELLVIKLSEDD